MSNESSPHRFSSPEDRRRVFDSAPKKLPEVQDESSGWIDLYQMLGVAPDASEFILDEAIIERGADAVFFAFSSQGKPREILQMEEHLREMRPILLDPATRRRYDDLRQKHLRAEPDAQAYDDFLSSLDLRDYSGCMSVVLIPLAVPLLWLLWQVRALA